MKTKRILIGLLVFMLGLTALVCARRQAILDWALLYNYAPPAAVAQLASDDTMTTQARHLFYVNHPDISDGAVLTINCPHAREKTVVLGCYIGNDAGIYVYAVNDVRLNGVQQVTAAHEMLHAAYRRLSGGERKRVDAMLMSYYDNDLTDQRIKDTIDAYKVSEPNDVVNEMHSIFGTEVADLPAPLEQYYAQYFADRTKVTGYTASYQGEFTSRENQVSDYNAQLKTLKQQIDVDENQLTVASSALTAQKSQMDAERSSGDFAAYNSNVAPYNRAVRDYNALASSYKSLISQYNDIVAKLNAVVLEQQQLTQELSASAASNN